MRRISELSKESGIPESTARRWIEKHHHYFTVKRIGKTTYYHPDAIDVLKRLKTFYDAGRSTEEIEEILSLALPKTITIEPENPPPSEPLPERKDTLFSLIEKTIDQRREIQLLAVQLLRKSEEVNTLKDQVRTLQTETAALKNSTTERIEGHAWEISKLRDELEALRRKIEPEPVTLWRAFKKMWKK